MTLALFIPSALALFKPSILFIPVSSLPGGCFNISLHHRVPLFSDVITQEGRRRILPHAPPRAVVVVCWILSSPRWSAFSGCRLASSVSFIDYTWADRPTTSLQRTFGHLRPPLTVVHCRLPAIKSFFFFCAEFPVRLSLIHHVW